MDVLQLIARISLDTTEYERGLSKAKSDADGMSGAIGGAMSKVGSAIGGAVKLAAAGVTAATGAVTAFAGASVKAGMSFDSAMAQVAATSGKTVDEISNLRDFAQQMGATTAFSATQAAEALNYMALAGYDADQSMGMLPNVLNLAAAGGMELATASDMVTDAATALGLTLEDGSVDIQRTTQMVDEMAKVSSKTNTSVSQLGDAMLTVGGTAKTLSGGFYTLADGTQVAYDGTAELSQALGLLADNGIKGSEGGTKLRNMILSLSAPTDKAASQLKNLGVSVFDAEGNMRSLKDVFGDLSAAMSDMSAEDRVNVINDIFNKTDLKAVNALLGTNAERWDEVAEAIHGAKGAADAMAKTRLKNLAGDVTMFKSAWEGVQIAISDGVTPKLREFVKMGTKGLSDITEAIRKGDWEGAFSILGDTLGNAIAKFADTLPKVVDFGGRLISALANGLFQNIDTLIESAEKILDSFMQGMLRASEGGSGASEVMQKISDALIRNAAMFMEVGGQILLNIINGLTENLPSLIETAGQILLTIATGIGKSLPELVPAVVDVILTIVQSILENIDLVVEGAIALVTGLAEGIVNALPVLAEKAPQIILALVNAIVENLPGLTTACVEIVLALGKGIIENLPELVFASAQIVATVIQGIHDGFQAMWDTGMELIGQLGEAILSTDTAQWGLETIGKFMDGVSQKWDELMAFMAPALDAFKYLFDTAMQAIQILTETIMTAISDKISEIWNGIVQFMSPILQSIHDAVMNAWNAIATEILVPLQDIWNNIKEKFDAVVASALEWGTHIIDNLVEGIRGGIDRVGAVVTSVADKIKSLIGFSVPEDGPLSDFDTYGPDMMELLAQGVENSVDAMAERIKIALDTVKQVFITFMEEVVALFNGDEGLLTQINNAFEEWSFTLVNDTLPTLFTSILDLITRNMSEDSELYTVIRTFFENVQMMINESLSGETETGILFKLQTLFAGILELLDTQLLGEGGVLGKLQSFFTDVLGRITSFMTSLNSTITSQLNTIVTTVRAKLNEITTFVSGWITTQTSALQRFVSTVQTTITNALNTWNTQIRTWFTTLGSWLQTTFKTWDSDLRRWFDTAKTFINGWFEKMKQFLQDEWFKDLNKFLHDWFTDLKDFLEDDWFAELNTFLEDWFDDLREYLDEWFEETVSGIKEAMSEAKQAVKKACKKIEEIIHEVVDSAYGWGAELGQNFADGIWSKVAEVEAAAAALAAAAAGAIHFSTPDYGPLKEEDKWGGELVDNFINSMMSRAGALREATENVFDLKEAMLSSGEDVGSGFIDGLVEGIKEGGNFLKDAVSDLNGVMTANVNMEDGQTGMMGGYTQIINNYSPEPLDASEIARQTRNATQGMVLALRSA